MKTHALAKWSALASCAALTTALKAAPVTNAWDTRLAVGLDVTRGNSETLRLNVNLTADRKDEDKELRTGIQFSYGETDMERTEENGKATVQYNDLISDQGYLYGNLELSYDDIANIDYRLLAGPGVGWYVLRTEDHSLSGEIGVSYRYEQTSYTEMTEEGSRTHSQTDDAIALRLAQRYEGKVGAASKLWETVEYLPTVDDFSRYLLNAEIGLDVPINSHLDLRVMIHDRYNSTPALGIDKNDLAVKAAFVFRFTP